MKIIDIFNKKFQHANILKKIIYINVCIFLLLNVLSVFAGLLLVEFTIFEKFMLPSNTKILVEQPWSIFTYMFLHQNILHLAFNMILLYFGGKIFLNNFTEKHFLNVYFFGGIFGGLIFILAFNYLPALIISNELAKALGASASVLAIFFAVATKAPNYVIHSPFIGNIKLKYLAFFLIILDFISIPKGNAGGHIAHIGGAIFGYLFVKNIKKSTSKKTFINLNFIFDKIFKSQNKKHIYKDNRNDFEYNKQRAQKQKEVNNILEKISKSGYSSLNEKEKEILFNESKK